MRLSRILVAAIFVALFMVAGCGRSNEVEIPDYPGAEVDQQHDMGGMAQVKRSFTTDSYEDVLDFYKEELAQYEPTVRSYEVAGSRQTEINLINEKERVLSVVVQEFDGEDRVAIVIMGVSL